MPDAPKPRKGSKRDASSAEKASQRTEAQTDEVAPPSQEEMASQEARPAATSDPTEQQELTREQLERLRNRLKARYHR